MNKITYLSKLGLLTYWALLPWCLSAPAQNPYTGIWEGDFMEQFKTAILLDQVDAIAYNGKILMYSGETRIQDDELSRIVIEDGSISFYIAAKETAFQGTFNQENTSFTGNFIFPDQSRHPLTVRKYDGEKEAKNAPDAPWKEDLKLNIPLDQLKSDLKELIRKVKNNHPRLYRYTSEESFNAMAEEVLVGLEDDLTPEQYLYRIAPLLASLGCSHTGIRLPREYQRLLDEQGHFFPLKLFISDQRAYCLWAPEDQDSDLVPGMEILAINHSPVPQVIERLLALIPSEGNCLTTRYQELNRDFQHYFHMMDPSDEFYIEYASDNTKESLQLEAVPLSAINQVKSPESHGPAFHFQLAENPQMGILTISSFGIHNMDAYVSFLDSTFRIMKQTGTRDLVVDLRDNQGGHPIFAAQLLSYLTDSNFTYFQRNGDVQEFEPLYNPMDPNELHFTGEIYVLVNGNCLSTTGHLLSLLEYHTGAQFIGEEPGSSHTCNDNSILVILPNTGLEVNIPRTTFSTAVNGFNQADPFPVDYAVPMTVRDLLKDADSYMSFTRDLVRKKRT